MQRYLAYFSPTDRRSLISAETVDSSLNPVKVSTKLCLLLPSVKSRGAELKKKNTNQKHINKHVKNQIKKNVWEFVVAKITDTESSRKKFLCSNLVYSTLSRSNANRLILSVKRRLEPLIIIPYNSHFMIMTL